MNEDTGLEETGPQTDEEPSTADRTTIEPGRNFEDEFRLDAADAGRFLIDLGEQLRSGDELTVGTDEWELPFAFDESVDVEIDFDGVDEPELEIEVELRGATDADAPSVE
jgi:amphi-Trp domain-containing protein